MAHCRRCDGPLEKMCVCVCVCVCMCVRSVGSLAPAGCFSHGSSGVECAFLSALRARAPAVCMFGSLARKSVHVRLGARVWFVGSFAREFALPAAWLASLCMFGSLAPKCFLLYVC